MCSLLTHSYYYIGIRANLISIRDVPEENKTYNLCLAAIYHNGYAILAVPEHLNTAEMCMMAVKDTGYALKYVPEHMKTYEMCRITVERDEYALLWVPEEFQTDTIIRIALAWYPQAARFIKKNIPVIHGSPKQMPEKAYDLLEMEYDEQSAIQDGELMVDFHDEFKYGRFYRKKTFEDLVLESKKNPTTRARISEYTIYQAII